MDNKTFLKLLADYDRHCARIERSAQVKLGESTSEKAKRIKELEQEYTKWFEYYFSHYAKVTCADYHKKLAKLIIGNPKCRTLAEMYRGAGKSVHIDMGIPLYLYLVSGQLKFMLLFGATDPKSKKLISDIQAELKHNPRLKNDYGNKFQKGDWSEGDFYTTDGVRFMAMSFLSDPRGLREGSQRPDYIVVDDCDGKKHIANDRIMGERVDYIEEDIMGCFDTSDDCIERFVFCNNNFHKNSITNRLKKEYVAAIKQDKADRNKKSNYSVLTVNAVTDLRTFTPTWPQKTSANYWRDKYRKNRRSFMRERMNTHVADGKMFKNEMMRWKQMEHYSVYECLAFYGDLSYKEQGDYKALVLVGKLGREKHILHSFLRQVSRRMAAIWLYDLYQDKKLGRYNIIYKIEGLFAQDEFINDFDNEGDDRGFYIPIVPDKRPKEGKHDRVESLLGFFERSNVYWNADEKEDQDQIEAVEQFTSFEKGSKAHDDFPDATHGAFREIEEATMPQRSEASTSSRADTYKNSKHRT